MLRLFKWIYKLGYEKGYDTGHFEAVAEERGKVKMEEMLKESTNE